MGTNKFKFKEGLGPIIQLLRSLDVGVGCKGTPGRGWEKTSRQVIVCHDKFRQLYDHVKELPDYFATLLSLLFM